jgi:hypothetical protein
VKRQAAAGVGRTAGRRSQEHPRVGGVDCFLAEKASQKPIIPWKRLTA